MFKLPALTLALGRAIGSPTPVMVQPRDWPKGTHGRSKGILWLHRAGKRGTELPVHTASVPAQQSDATVLKPGCHLCRGLPGQHRNMGVEAATPLREEVREWKGASQALQQHPVCIRVPAPVSASPTPAHKITTLSFHKTSPSFAYQQTPASDAQKFCLKK